MFTMQNEEEEKFESQRRGEIKAREKRKKENGFDYLIFQLYHPINCCAQREENCRKKKRNTKGSERWRRENVFPPSRRARDESRRIRN
jgi:hypothetical protein